METEIPIPPGLKATVLAVNITSVLGCVFIMVSYLLFKKMRQLQIRTLLFCLSLSDLLISVAYLMNNGDGNTAVCKLQSLINIFGNQSSFLWTSCIAIYIYVALRHSTEDAKTYNKIYHVVSWGVPVIIVIFVASFNAWGYNSDVTPGWCWISATVANPFMWSVIAGKGLEWSSFLIITIMYVMVVYKSIATRHEQVPVMGAKLHVMGAKNKLKSWSKREAKFLIIPIAFILLRLPGSVNTVLVYTLSNYTPNNVLRYLMAIGDSAPGIVNALIFGVFTGGFVKCHIAIHQFLIKKNIISTYEENTVLIDWDTHRAHPPPPVV